MARLAACFSAALVAAYFAFLNIHPFLAVTHRVNTNVLVVEGWVPPYAIRGAAEEFKTSSYQHIFTTGGPWNGDGGYTNDYNTSASVGAAILKKFGLPDDLVQMVPSRVSGRDRTYSSAVALRDWFREHNTPVHSINVLTVDAHARRTRLLYQKALGGVSDPHKFFLTFSGLHKESANRLAESLSRKQAVDLGIKELQAY